MHACMQCSLAAPDPKVGPCETTMRVTDTNESRGGRGLLY